MKFPTEPDPDTAKPEPPPEPDRPHVLIAEDDDDFRGLLSSALRADGYRVTAVDAGVPLLHALWSARRRGEEPPSLIISDERMPGIRGLQVFRHARDEGMTLPLVLITAFGDDELIAKAAEIGVVLIRKPFEIDDLRIVTRFLTSPSHRAPRRSWNVGSAQAKNRRAGVEQSTVSPSAPRGAKRDRDAEEN